MQECRRVDCPLHDRLVDFGVRELCWRGDGSDSGPRGEDVVEVEELEGGARGLEEEDHEEGDDGEPELGGAEPPRAATADLSTEGKGIVTNTFFAFCHLTIA